MSVISPVWLQSWIHCYSPQPTPVGSVHIDSGASAVTRESHPHRDRPSQHPPIRNQVRPVEQWGPDCFLPCCGPVDPWCITAWNSLYSLYDDLFAKQSLCACSDNRMCYASILLNISVYLNAGKFVLRHQGKFIPVIFAFVFLDLLCALDIVDKLLASV